MRSSLLASVLSLAVFSTLVPGAVAAFELAGTKQVALVTKDDKVVPIGKVTFTKQGDKTDFTLDVDTSKFKTFFLSMRDFKCLEGTELQCFVPYPYKTPGTVTANDLTWLAHSLLFFFKDKNAYGAPMGNGLYYDLKMTDKGIEGAPEAIDLNAIASPPEKADVPPYDKDTRTPIEGDARWVKKLTIMDAPTE